MKYPISRAIIEECGLSKFWTLWLYVEEIFEVSIDTCINAKFTCYQYVSKPERWLELWCNELLYDYSNKWPIAWCHKNK